MQRGRDSGTVAAVEVLVFDLASLRYRWDAARSALSMFSPLREQLALVHPPAGTSDREAATLACDQALELCRLRRSVVDEQGSPAKVRYRIALYNPYTAKIALGAVPHTRVFGDFAPIDVAASGLAAHLEGDGDAVCLVLADGRRLERNLASVAELTRDLAANRR